MNQLTVSMLNMAKTAPPPMPIPKTKAKPSATVSSARQAAAKMHSISPGDTDEEGLCDEDDNDDEDDDDYDDDDEGDDNDGDYPGAKHSHDAFNLDDNGGDDNNDEMELDEIVDNLREIYKLEEKTGTDIDKALAQTLKEIFAKPLGDEGLNVVLSRHKVPGNLGKLLDSDRTNREVWILTPIPMRRCDAELQKVQMLNLRSIVPLLRIHQEAKKQGGPLARAIMPHIRDAIILSVTANDKLVTQRKFLLKPFVDGSFHGICQWPEENEDFDPAGQVHLFGDKIGDRVTELQTAQAI